MAEFQGLFIIAEFLYSKGIWHQLIQFVLAGFNLSLELNSGSLWGLTGLWMACRISHGEWMPCRSACRCSWQPYVTRSYKIWLILIFGAADCNCSLAKPHNGMRAGVGEESSLTQMPGRSNSLFLMVKHVLGWTSVLVNLVIFWKKVRKSQYRTQKTGMIMQNGVNSLDCF